MLVHPGTNLHEAKGFVPSFCLSNSVKTGHCALVFIEFFIRTSQESIKKTMPFIFFINAV